MKNVFIGFNIGFFIRSIVFMGLPMKIHEVGLFVMTSILLATLVIVEVIIKKEKGSIEEEKDSIE